MNRFTNLGLALGSGLLLFAAWPVSPLTPLIFVAWIPLIWLETKVKSRKKFLGLTYITMFAWNVSTTWWIWNASAPGAVAAFLANSFIMCLPWLGYKIAKKWLGETAGFISLIAFWMAFEYIHLQDWGLSWPWLTLGNVFAVKPEWVQWYEYTGTAGGTLWILLVNIFLFRHLQENMQRTTAKNYKQLLIAVALLLLPVFISLFGFRDTRNDYPLKTRSVVVVQPNIDPYEKVSTGSFEAQLEQLVRTTEELADSTTALIIWPETALYMGNGIEETQMKNNFLLAPLWGFLQRHPGTELFTGVESYRELNAKTKYSREFNGIHFESYNGSALLDSAGAHAFYHKSMLVPGVETLPWFLKFIDKWFEKFGGTTAGYAKQKERSVLETKAGFRIAPSICYESIYGDFMRRYVKNGANLICIITNDGWWKKTPGHKQHMNYARLRAIETRTWLARSANTGISCFIGPRGNVIQPQPYNTRAAIKMEIPVREKDKKTFYVRNGDLLSKLMTVGALLLLCRVIFLKTRKKFLLKQKAAD